MTRPAERTSSLNKRAHSASPRANGLRGEQLVVKVGHLVEGRVFDGVLGWGRTKPPLLHFSFDLGAGCVVKLCRVNPQLGNVARKPAG